MQVWHEAREGKKEIGKERTALGMIKFMNREIVMLGGARWLPYRSTLWMAFG